MDCAIRGWPPRLKPRSQLDCAMHGLTTKTEIPFTDLDCAVHGLTTKIKIPFTDQDCAIHGQDPPYWSGLRSPWDWPPRQITFTNLDCVVHGQTTKTKIMFTNLDCPIQELTTRTHLSSGQSQSWVAQSALKRKGWPSVVTDGLHNRTITFATGLTESWTRLADHDLGWP